MPVTRSSKKLLTQVVEVTTEVTKSANATAKKRRTTKTKVQEVESDGKVITTKKKKVTQVTNDINGEESIEIEVKEEKNINYISQFAEGLEFIVDIDPTLKTVISRSRFPLFYADVSYIDKSTPESQYHEESQACFAALARGIIGQQVSGAAAQAILGRFKAVFDDDLKEEVLMLNPEMYPTKKEFDQKKRELANKGNSLSFPEPSAVLEASDETLRAAGLSNRKVEYMKGLAEAFTNGSLSDEILKSSPDDEVVDKIVALKGFGPWSADMFLLFTLKRMDVFSIGDLGVQRGFMNYVSDRPWLQQELKSVDWTLPLPGTHSPGKSDKAQNRKPATVSKTVKSFGGSAPIHKQMEWVANKFKPYRSVFQMILWKLSDINLDILEKK